MLRILIADDHAVVRSGLQQFLAGESDMNIEAEAHCGLEALARVEAEPWDLLLLDIALPDINGIEVLKRVKQIRPELPVLIFSMFSEEDYAESALEAGASGFLPKDTEPWRIVEAIRCVCRGDRYLSPKVAEMLIARLDWRGKPSLHNKLSAREFEVIKMLSRGMSLIDIGVALYLSPKTVSTYRARILEKLNLKNNVELARYVIEHRLDRERPLP
jgi:two-component system invasion response regulator UvrY